MEILPETPKITLSQQWHQERRDFIVPDGYTQSMPDNIISQIFNRLDPYSLMKAMQVSKYWNHLISTQPRLRDKKIYLMEALCCLNLHQRITFGATWKETIEYNKSLVSAIKTFKVEKIQIPLNYPNLPKLKAHFAHLISGPYAVIKLTLKTCGVFDNRTGKLLYEVEDYATVSSDSLTLQACSDEHFFTICMCSFTLRRFDKNVLLLKQDDLHDSQIVIYHNNTVFYLNKDGGITICKIDEQKDKQENPETIKISDIYQSEFALDKKLIPFRDEEVFWITTEDGGLHCFDLNEKKFAYHSYEGVVKDYPRQIVAIDRVDDSKIILWRKEYPRAEIFNFLTGKKILSIPLCTSFYKFNSNVCVSFGNLEGTKLAIWDMKTGNCKGQINSSIPLSFFYLIGKRVVALSDDKRSLIGWSFHTFDKGERIIEQPTFLHKFAFPTGGFAIAGSLIGMYHTQTMKENAFSEKCDKTDLFFLNLLTKIDPHHSPIPLQEFRKIQVATTDNETLYKIALKKNILSYVICQKKPQKFTLHLQNFVFEKYVNVPNKEETSSKWARMKSFIQEKISF